MAKGITEKEPDPRIVYADIIDLPHYESPNYPRMSMRDRAAQFSSFKAMSGYEDLIAEYARQTEKKIELEESELERLNQKLSLLRDLTAAGERPSVTITRFVPDERKEGGSYVTVTEQVKRIDTAARKVVLCSRRSSGSNETIRIADITDITGEPVDFLDNE